VAGLWVAYHKSPPITSPPSSTPPTSSTLHSLLFSSRSPMVEAGAIERAIWSLPPDRTASKKLVLIKGGNRVPVWVLERTVRLCDYIRVEPH